MLFRWIIAPSLRFLIEFITKNSQTSNDVPRWTVYPRDRLFFSQKSRNPREFHTFPLLWDNLVQVVTSSLVINHFIFNTCWPRAHSEWIIGIYLHEFTNDEREISIPHGAAECGIENFEPQPWCNDSDVLNLHHGYYTTIMMSRKLFRHNPESRGTNQPIKKIGNRTVHESWMNCQLPCALTSKSIRFFQPHSVN